MAVPSAPDRHGLPQRRTVTVAAAAAATVVLLLGILAVVAATPPRTATAAATADVAPAVELHPVARAMCPTARCGCRRPSVVPGLKKASTVVEVLVLGCAGGSYTVRVNQYHKGCSRQYVGWWAVGVRAGWRALEPRGAGRHWRGSNSGLEPLCEGADLGVWLAG